MEKETILKIIQDEIDLLSKQWESNVYQPPSEVESIYGLPSAYERTYERLECKILTLKTIYEKVKKAGE